VYEEPTYIKVDVFVYIGALVEILPPFNTNVPAIVGVVANDSVPAFIAKSLNVTATEPFTVPAFANETVPVPLVKVPLLVNVPLALMFKNAVARALQLNVPPFTKLPAVIDPELVSVNVPEPTVVIALVTVPMPPEKLAVAVMPVLTVIEEIGVFVKAPAMLKL
jgi:hypothetical protein